MSYKFYIHNDVFSVLVSLLQKGLTHNSRFFIYDEMDSIQNRLWTFSSTAFIPNIKSNDTLAKQYQVPFIISIETSATVPDNYKPIIYQNITQKPPIDSGIIILQSRDEITKITEIFQIKTNQCEVYIKNQNIWSSVLL